MSGGIHRDRQQGVCFPDFHPDPTVLLSTLSRSYSYLLHVVRSGCEKLQSVIFSAQII